MGRGSLLRPPISAPCSAQRCVRGSRPRVDPPGVMGQFGDPDRAGDTEVGGGGIVAPPPHTVSRTSGARQPSPIPGCSVRAVIRLGEMSLFLAMERRASSFLPKIGPAGIGDEQGGGFWLGAELLHPAAVLPIRLGTAGRATPR